MNLTHLFLKDLKKEGTRPAFKMGLAIIDAIASTQTKPIKKNVRKKRANDEYISFVESK